MYRKTVVQYECSAAAPDVANPAVKVDSEPQALQTYACKIFITYNDL